MGDEDPRKIISSALISSPKGVTLYRLLQDYKSFTGQDIPYRQMGYGTVEEYLRSMPETCRIAGYGREALVLPVVNEQNKHINEMILKQKAPKNNPRSRARNIKRSRGIYDCSSFVSKPEPEYRTDFKLPDTMPDSHLRVIPPPPEYFRDIRRNIPQIPQKTPESGDKPGPSKISTDNNDTVLNSLQSDNAAALSEESDYDEYFNELNFSDDESGFNYRSDSESVDLSTSMKNLHQPSNQIPMLDPNETSRPDHVSRINDNVKEKLRILIFENPDGIWCSKLLKMYRERFKHNLDPLDFGFSSVIQLCDDIPDVFHCIRPNRMDWKLYDSRKPVPDVHSMRDLSKYISSLAIDNERCDNTEPALPANLINLSPSYKYPETVLQPDETIKRLKMPGDDQIDMLFEMNVSEVYDPSKFWIQLRGEDTLDALDTLMDKMQHFYMHNAGSLQLNEFSVRIGLFVAALFSNEYHRAVVVKVFNDQTLKVFYVDYGTVAEVSLRKTCLLHRDFASLPQQAIRSRLDNIVPIDQNTMWPREASQFMLSMVMEKSLFGLIRSIDREQQILHLILTDTTQDIDIHINDELVNHNYAALGNEAPICSSSSANVANVHLYPSFEEIENGIYPNVGEIIKLLKLGYTYETIFHGYFHQSVCTKSPELCGNVNDNSRCEDDQTDIPEIVKSPSPPVNTARVAGGAPPGFEHIQFNTNPIKSPLLPTPACPPTVNLAYVNPYLYNQVLLQQNLMWQQQRQTLLQQQQNSLWQYQFQEYQKNLNKSSSPQGSNKNMYDHFVESNPQDLMRNVIELKFDHFNIHVIKLENDYYVVTQEIISTLLNSNLSFKNWLNEKGLNINSFPNKLINLTNYETVYNELIKFKIPGIYKANNLGCNTRVTLLHDVIDIIYNYGDPKIIPELRNGIKNATESQYLWEVLHSSD